MTCRYNVLAMLVAAVMIGLPVFARGYDEVRQPYEYTIERLAEAFNFSTITLPDTLMLCRREGEGVMCWMVPPGSLLLIPRPDSAPVDTLPKDNYEGDDE